MFISSEVCFVAFLIVVYIRYEITQSLANFFLCLSSLLLCIVQLVCAHVTGIFIVHESSRWYCSRYHEAHLHFTFFDIIHVSLLDSDSLHYGLVFWWSTYDCQPVNDSCRHGNFWILLGVLLVFYTAPAAHHNSTTHRGSTSNMTMQHGITGHLSQ